MSNNVPQERQDFMKKLIVGGTFDETNGKPSYIVEQLAISLGWNCVNGGNLDFIHTFNPIGIDVLLWMPNISNDEAKVLVDLKKKNPHMILIQSKRVIEKEYFESDVVGRLLKSHALLGIMITKEENKYRFRLLDPLGNQWVDTFDIAQVGHAINARINYLSTLSRIQSKQVVLSSDCKVLQNFVEVVKKYGTEFTKFVNAVNPNRLLGNASTRCAKGFPAIRMQDHILVTKRNVDKQTLAEDDFVLVKAGLDEFVQYAGDYKPSVDTPIQLKLFEYYKNVNFIIHGHAYVGNSLATHDKLPCGYIQEFDEIIQLVPERGSKNFNINLTGHGCLILADNLEYLEDQIQLLYARPFPEK